MENRVFRDSPISDIQTVVKKIREIVLRCGLHYDPASGIQYFSGYGDSIFTCEAFFDIIALNHMRIHPQLGINTLRVYLRQARENGHIPRHWDCEPAGSSPANNYWSANRWRELEDEEHAQPFLWQMALFISRRGKSASWITEEEYESLRRYLNLWVTEWDRDKNGLSEWASAPHAMADTSFDRAGRWRSKYCEGVDLNCLLFVEFQAAEMIARSLGKNADAIQFAKEAALKKERIQTLLWDEKDGFFYDRDIRSGERIRVKAAHNFMPLWARVATDDQVRRIVNEHLTDPSQFWTPYPVPSYARSEPNYTQYYQPAGSDPIWDLSTGHANFQGGTWPQLNYLICHGLMNYGFRNEAQHIARISFELAAANPFLYEYFNAETGKGMGGYPFWSGAQVLMSLLESELAGGFNPSEIKEVDSPLDSAPVWMALGDAELFSGG